MNTRHFLLKNFFTFTYVILAAEGIEPNAVRLRARRLAAEQSASVRCLLLCPWKRQIMLTSQLAAVQVSG